MTVPDTAHAVTALEQSTYVEPGIRKGAKH